MLWKGSHVPQEEDEEEAVTKKAVKELEIFVPQIFYNFFLFISFFFQLYFTYHFFYTFFTHDIYPHPHPQPTTHDLYPRPTTFSYTSSTKLAKESDETLYWYYGAAMQRMIKLRKET